MRIRHLVVLGGLVGCGSVAGDKPDAAEPPADATFPVFGNPLINWPVMFTAVGATDNGAGASYAWSFGSDGTPSSSTDATTTAMFATTGNETVSLTVTNGSCTNTTSQTICAGTTGSQIISF